MNDTKSFLVSKTFWGALVAIGASLASVFHLNIDLAGIDDQIIAVIGGVIAIIGRFSATKTVTVTGQ